MSVKTYSSKAIITHDGIDDNGVRAEVKVINGYGHVDEIKKSKNGNAGNVVFVVQNNIHTTSGWAPMDSNVMQIALEAQKNNEPIYFRVEVRRKTHIDRTLPMSEVSPPKDMNAAKENIDRSLAAVKSANEEKWVISPHAVTRIEEDPKQGGQFSAYDHDLEELQNKKSDNPNATTVVTGTTFSTYNSNGKVDPGSIAVSGPLVVYSFVAEWNRTNKTELSDANVLTLSKVLLAVINKLQLAIYDDEPVDAEFSLGALKNARQVVFDVIKNFYPITSETVSDKESLKLWADEVSTKSTGMWKWSISEVEKMQ